MTRLLSGFDLFNYWNIYMSVWILHEIDFPQESSEFNLSSASSKTPSRLSLLGQVAGEIRPGIALVGHTRV